MAKMYPKKFSGKQNKEDPERIVFEKLKNAQDTEGWTVFHSVRLPGKPPKVYPEIDFIVVVPGKGIICLEVKGGRRISWEDGKWYREDSNRRRPLDENPFDQVESATRNLRDCLKEEFMSKGFPEPRCVVGHMVVFPQAECPKSPRFKRWEVIDLNNIESIHLSITKGMRKWCDRLKKTENMSSEERKRIVDFLTLYFNSNRAVKKNIWIKESEGELLKLTKKQYQALDMLKYNERCLFLGAAGTGKTMLAVKSALNASQEGKNVLLVCYNSLLSQWLVEQTEENETIVAGTLHKVVKDLIEKTKYRDEFLEETKHEDGKDKLFNETYMEYGVRALEELGEEPPFGLIVMDEAQDLVFQEPVMNFLEYAVHGGLENGHWAFFGDFSHQNIYSDKQDKQKDPSVVLKSYCKDFATNPPLMENCRNTKNIAKETYLLSELEDSPSMLYKEDDGLEVDYNYWSGFEDLTNSLEKKIEHLNQQDGVSLEDIVILSSDRLLDCVKKIKGFSLENVSRNLNAGRRKKVVKYSTIHSFKGLESSVIIVVAGREEVSGDRSQSLLYVSMSRAKSLLIMMIDKRAMEAVSKTRKRET